MRRGEEGELCARGYALMRGYWADPARTAEVVDEHGWLHTGDLATMDEGGYVRITGRLKDIIIRGGENISSREVEQLLAGHPDVDEACVIGVPDAAMGEQAMAWVRLRPGAAAHRRRASPPLLAPSCLVQGPPPHPHRGPATREGRRQLRQAPPSGVGLRGAGPRRGPRIRRRVSVAEGKEARGRVNPAGPGAGPGVSSVGRLALCARITSRARCSSHLLVRR